MHYHNIHKQLFTRKYNTKNGGPSNKKSGPSNKKSGAVRKPTSSTLSKTSTVPSTLTNGKNTTNTSFSENEPLTPVSKFGQKVANSSPKVANSVPPVSLPVSKFGQTTADYVPPVSIVVPQVAKCAHCKKPWFEGHFEVCETLQKSKKKAKIKMLFDKEKQ